MTSNSKTAKTRDTALGMRNKEAAKAKRPARSPGFAAMDPQRHREVSTEGGLNGSLTLKRKAAQRRKKRNAGVIVPDGGRPDA